jgi:N-6 DNA Methylase
MNLAIRGIGANIAQGDSFHADAFPDLKADYVLANPPFNDSDWRGELLRNDKRWVYGTPPAGNANFETSDSNGRKGRLAADGRPACSRRQPTLDGRIGSAGTSGIAGPLPRASFAEPSRYNRSIRGLAEATEVWLRRLKKCSASESRAGRGRRVHVEAERIGWRLACAITTGWPPGVIRGASARLGSL